MRLPLGILPEKDEYFYSWFIRLASANGFTKRDFYRLFFEDNDVFYYHGYKNFFLFAEKLDFIGQSVLDAFYELRTENYELIGRSAAMQCRMVNSMFRFRSRFAGVLRYGKVNAMYCPECVREDIALHGFYYMHRAHQLSGVKVCYVHGCPLVSAAGDYGFSCKDLPLERTVVEIDGSRLELEQKFAEAAKWFLYHPCNIDYNSFRMWALGLLGNDSAVERFNASPFSALLGNDFAGFNKYIRSIKSMPARNVVLAALCAYGNDYERFVHEAGNPVSEPSVPEGYSIVSDDNRLLKVYSHNVCGHRFVQTEWGITHGFGCPYCQRDISDKDMFEHILNRTENGRYRLEGGFAGINKKVTIRDTLYDRTFRTSPSGFVFYGRRGDISGCRIRHEILDKLLGFEDFEVVDFKNIGEKVTLKHKKCGRDFKVGVYEFLSSPYCRKCFSKSCQQDYENRIKAVAGDEYSLVPEDNMNVSKILIRHNRCGKTKRYTMQSFLLGKRCECKSFRTTAKRVSQYLKAYTFGRYVLGGTHRNKDIVIDTVTGESMELRGSFIMQEILRPTPSGVLVLAPEVEAERIRLLEQGRKQDVFNCDYEEFYEYLKANYSLDSIIELKEIRYADMPYLKIRNMLFMLEAVGWLRRVCVGFYVFSENIGYNVRSLVEYRYIGLPGARRGYYMFGSDDRIYCNFYDGSRWAKREIDGFRFNVAASKVKDLDDRNVLILPVLDLLGKTGGYKNQETVVKTYIEKHDIEYEEFEPYLQYYQKVAENRLKKLYGIG